MRAIRFIHLWIWLILALPVAVLGVTGAVLTLEPLMTGPIDASASREPLHSANDILAAARSMAPDRMRVARYTPPRSPGSAASVQLLPPGAGRAGGVTLRIDPVTLVAIERSQGGGIFDWMRRLHISFLIPELAGRSIVGWVGIELVTLAVLGVPLWWPSVNRWKVAFTFSAKARGIRFHRRLHGAVGIWIVLVLLVNSFTGVVLGFPQLSRALMGIPGDGFTRAAASRAAMAPPLDLDAAFVLAKAVVPGNVPRMALLPAMATDPLRIFMSPLGGDGAAASSTVTLNSTGTKFIGVQGPANYSPMEMLLRWTHDLHEGGGLGLSWRILTALAGIALPVFAITGTSMWLLKRRNLSRMAQTQAMQTGY